MKPTPAATPLADTPQLRAQVIAACRTLRDLGFVIGSSGNVSIRLEDGLLVTPTRLAYDAMQPDDLVVVSWAGRVLRGERLPTSEMELHRQMLSRRPDFGAVIHSHSPLASVFACARQTLTVISDEMAELIGAEVGCTPYIAGGEHRAMAAAACDAIGTESCAVLLGNHGVIVGGRDLDEALAANQALERAALITLHAQAIGGVTPLSTAEARAERERFVHRYGSAEDLRDLLE